MSRKSAIICYIYMFSFLYETQIGIQWVYMSPTQVLTRPPLLSISMVAALVPSDHTLGFLFLEVGV